MGDPRQVTDDTGTTDEPGDELSGLDVFTDKDGKRFAVHQFGYTIGLDDLPEGDD